ncbi:hypothetical protein Tco_1492424 [Tanacetum coccineum]
MVVMTVFGVSELRSIVSNSRGLGIKITNTLGGKSSTVVRRRVAHLMETVFSHQNLSLIHAPGDNTSIRASPYGGCCVAHGNMVHIYDWMLEEDPPISHVDGI